MKKHVRSVLFLGLFILLQSVSPVAQAGYNQWTGSGPNGGLMTVLVIDPGNPSTLYAGTQSGGVFKSTNGGVSWNPVNIGLTDNTIYALAIEPAFGPFVGLYNSTIYAGTAVDGVFKSTNGGATWNPANTGLTDGTIYSLLVDPINPHTLYAGTQFGGVFKSTNGGESWSASNAPFTNVHGLAIATPFTLYAATYIDYAGKGGRHLREHRRRE